MLTDSAKITLSRPAFIVLDGPNGAGKTTLQRGISAFLTQHGIQNIITREPGAGDLGGKIRALLLGQGPEKMNERAELFLFAADRAEHVAKTIRPALAAGKTVICDRYYYSTVAFQGYGRKLDLEMIKTINAIAIDGTLPHLTFILDIDPKTGLLRNQRESLKAGDDSFEGEALDFHRRLREGFLETARTVKEPCVILDANRAAEVVSKEALAILKHAFGI